MSVDLNSLKKIAEGKTKIIYENPDDQIAGVINNNGSHRIHESIYSVRHHFL